MAARRLISWFVCVLCFGSVAMAQGAVEVSVTVRADQPGPVINPNIYGQFAEHLGAGIYEGIWVGEKSQHSQHQRLSQRRGRGAEGLHVPVVRWPGGCFADEYHWRDGIGPRDKRPGASQYRIGAASPRPTTSARTSSWTSPS